MILDKFGYSDYSPFSTPYDPSIQLIKNTNNPVNQEKYAQIIGSLLYLANRTRPNIAYAISRPSRYNSNPSISHWTALERVFRYLKSTFFYELKFVSYPAVLEGYTEANWISDFLDIKSTFGYVFTLSGSAISW